MPSQEEYQQFTARVKDELGKRLKWVSLALLDAGLVQGESDGKYIFVGWAASPMTREQVQFSLDFTAEITAGTDVDALVDKLSGQVVEYFYSKQIIALN